MAFFFQVLDVQPLESKGDTEKKQIDNENDYFHGANDTVFVSWSREPRSGSSGQLAAGSRHFTFFISHFSEIFQLVYFMTL
jgi:hypothetical protein